MSPRNNWLNAIEVGNDIDNAFFAQLMPMAGRVMSPLRVDENYYYTWCWTKQPHYLIHWPVALGLGVEAAAYVTLQM